MIRPPWAEKRPDRQPEFSGDESDSVLSKEQLRALRSQQGWPHFKDVFMLSSVDREDVGTLKVRVTPALQTRTFLFWIEPKLMMLRSDSSHFSLIRAPVGTSPDSTVLFCVTYY